MRTLKAPKRMLSPDPTVAVLGMFWNQVQNVRLYTGFGSAQNVNPENYGGKQKPLHISYGRSPTSPSNYVNPPCPAVSPEPELETRTECWVTLPEKTF